MVQKAEWKPLVASTRKNHEPERENTLAGLRKLMPPVRFCKTLRVEWGGEMARWLRALGYSGIGLRVGHSTHLVVIPVH